MSRHTVLSAKDIIVRKALPFSVYGADNMLLLAKGQVVGERIRAALLRNDLRPAYLPEEMDAPHERIAVRTCAGLAAQSIRTRCSDTLMSEH